MNKSHTHGDEGVYKLHIDFVPHPAHKVSPKPVEPSVIKKAKTIHAAHKGEKSKTWVFIKDKLHFVLVSVAVFFAIYIVLNWSALWINAVHYWQVWRGFRSPLENLVAQRQEEPERLLPEITYAQSAESVIPPLNIEVYPTDMRIIIPRINQNVPVIGVTNENLISREWEDLEADIQHALRNGVVHYPGTALPGDNGNIVITGHSSFYAWDPGRFKDVFALLHGVRKGDRIVVYFNQKKFTYEVYDIRVVLPKNVDVLGPTPAEQLTLITCTPIGTNLKRLIVIGKLVQKN